MSDALKPCPFCGGEALRCQNHEGKRPEAMIWVLCKSCHASPGDFATEEQAFAAWNRREEGRRAPAVAGEVEGAVAELRKQLPLLDAAAIPTKSEVFTLCGPWARTLHDAIEIVIAALASSPVQAVEGEAEPVADEITCRFCCDSGLDEDAPFGKCTHCNPAAPPAVEAKDVKPRTYAYVYPDHSGGEVWRYDTGGREINGSRPLRAVALYDHPAPLPAKDAGEWVTVPREALNNLITYADLMPKKTPAPGACSTAHPFTIEAGAIWGLDKHVTEVKAALAASPSPVGPTAEAMKAALEPFADIGAWLFARDLPDDTPIVTVTGIGKTQHHLTRGMFKAAHLAVNPFLAALSVEGK